MTKHTLKPNNFYFMKPDKIVKKQISLFAHGQVHLIADHFFSQAHLNSNNKKLDRKNEDVHAFKNG